MRDHMNSYSTEFSSSSQEELQPREISQVKRHSFALEVAGAAIFGAISLVTSVYITPIILRVPGWGFAFFDPVSVVWLTAFLIFGFRCGLMTLVIGSIGLYFFDPTGIGPLMKFFATIWFILIPYVFLRLKTKKKPQGTDLKALKHYIPSMLIAWAIRVPVMFILNIIVLRMWNLYDIVNLAWLGLADVSGISAILITVILLNTIQSIGDAVIPYLLVFTTKIYDEFKIW